MTPFASVVDYTTRTGDVLDAAGIARIQALLEDATAYIRSRLPQGYEPPAEIAKAICVTMVIRAARNPGGIRRREIGDYAEDMGEAGGLYLTESELLSLQPGYGEDGAYSLGPDDFTDERCCR